MSIPNPNPNIADGIKSDNKTYSSNKIESLISAATELPIPGAGDAGKVLTVNEGATGYELDTPDNAQSIAESIADDLIAIETVTLFTEASIGTATEYNSTDDVAIPAKTGYKAIGVSNVRAYGHHGSKCILYAWLGTTGIAYSCYNPSTTVTTTTTGTCDVIYIKDFS